MEDLGAWALGFEDLDCLLTDLATRYRDGDGVAQNLATAAALYRKAAERGGADSQLLLATCYLKGVGVEQNIVVAAGAYTRSLSSST
jgi:TPR repeat protein